MQAYAVAKDAQADLQTTQDALTELSQNHTNEAMAAQISTNDEILASDISTQDAGLFDYAEHETSADQLQAVSDTIAAANQDSRAIAAHYAHIIVNGKSYYYCATINVNKHTGTPSDVLPFGTDDGGIAFQTCNNDGTTVQVNRYDAD